MSTRSNVIPFGKGKRRHAVARDNDLSSEHREYIKARGIKLETAIRAGLSSHKGNLRFPYFALDGSKTGFIRTRRFSGRSKFTQKKGTKPRLYYGPLRDMRWTQVAKDTTINLYLWEGETRARSSSPK